MAEQFARRRLDQPRVSGRMPALPRLTVNVEWLARFAERLARFPGLPSAAARVTTAVVTAPRTDRAGRT